MQWSPLGTYLATVHRQGSAVWGGASTFNRLMRYAHPQVIYLHYTVFVSLAYAVSILSTIMTNAGETD